MYALGIEPLFKVKTQKACVKLLRINAVNGKKKVALEVRPLPDVRT
jgi:hypothetical protein